MKFAAGIALILGLAGAAAQASPEAYLRIGDPAPSLESARWVKGAPVRAFRKGRCYVVEFWATWCGPCRENIPHVTELARAYKGRADFIGVDIWESQKAGGGDALPKVAKFVKEQGAKMGYRVAADVPEGRIAGAWMKPASESGIPCAFIVDGEGRVAWIGHPAKVEDALKEVLAGTYDLAAARARRETELEITRPIEEAMTARNYPKAIEVIGAAIAKRPALEHSLTYQQLVALYHADLAQGIRRSRQILEDSGHEPGAYWMMMAIFAVETDLSPEAYAFGRTLAGEVEQRGLGNFMFTAMKADLCFNAGDREQAIRLGEEALAAAGKDPHATPANLALIRKNLDKHRAAAR